MLQGCETLEREVIRLCYKGSEYIEQQAIKELLIEDDELLRMATQNKADFMKFFETRDFKAGNVGAILKTLKKDDLINSIRIRPLMMIFGKKKRALWPKDLLWTTNREGFWLDEHEWWEHPNIDLTFNDHDYDDNGMPNSDILIEFASFFTTDHLWRPPGLPPLSKELKENLTTLNILDLLTTKKSSTEKEEEELQAYLRQVTPFAPFLPFCIQRISNWNRHVVDALKVLNQCLSKHNISSTLKVSKWDHKHQNLSLFVESLGTLDDPVSTMWDAVDAIKMHEKMYLNVFWFDKKKSILYGVFSMKDWWSMDVPKCSLIKFFFKHKKNNAQS